MRPRNWSGRPFHYRRVSSRSLRRRRGIGVSVARVNNPPKGVLTGDYLYRG
jgi:hypothetical protein